MDYRLNTPQTPYLDTTASEMGLAPSMPVQGMAKKRPMSAWDWGDDQVRNENIGSVFKGGLSALGGILGQGEQDRANQMQAAVNEDALARDAYNAKRRAAFQSGALASLAVR